MIIDCPVQTGYILYGAFIRSTGNNQIFCAGIEIYLNKATLHLRNTSSTALNIKPSIYCIYQK